MAQDCFDKKEEETLGAVGSCRGTSKKYGMNNAGYEHGRERQRRGAAVQRHRLRELTRMIF